MTIALYGLLYVTLGVAGIWLLNRLSDDSPGVDPTLEYLALGFCVVTWPIWLGISTLTGVVYGLGYLVSSRRKS